MADPEKRALFLEGLAASRKRAAKTRTKHGLCESPEYKVWSGMVQRCTNPKYGQFKDYGGRGIKVAPEWMGRGGFKKWIEHIGRRPTDKHTIGRINNDGNYEPGNVRWETRDEQMKNTRHVWNQKEKG